MGDVKIPQINNVTIAGRLARDPELRYTQSGKAVATLSVCHNRYWKDSNGQQVTDATFVDVTVWERAAEYIAEKLKKGRPVLVEGALKQETWEDQGQKRSKISITASRVHALDWDGDGQGAGQARESQGAQGYSGRRNGGPPPPPAPRQAPPPPPPPRQEQFAVTPEPGYWQEEDIPF